MITQNIVYSNAEEKPGIGNEAAGSKELPVRILNNLVTRERAVGIGLMSGGVSVVEGNIIAQTGSVGIAVNGSTVLKLNRNRITKTGAPGIVIIAGSEIHEMQQNIVTNTRGPKMRIKESKVVEK
ncbi:copper-binding protein (NosD) [Candidatus Electrothrix aarhusensis]|uniref:Copper-binding protein (NosD) n=1 Tax=Candidatus Electrothrix aarhusensis TaxID=1859131 RepID=A0A444IXG0_9BACT|nr:copper-binding protein (NosD) [Candidatus Electrothrix aarhusensis]